MVRRSREFVFITLFTIAVTVIITGQAALGSSATNIFNENLTGVDGQGQSSPLKGMNFSETTEVYSHRGILETTLLVDEREGMVGNQSVKAITYNGSLNGPTLHIKPGERMVMNYINELDQPTNIHFHGLHVSPSGSSDNVFRVIGSGETAKYVLDIPIDHAPGTFWYHSHLHGLSTVQVGGGLSGLLVIEGLEDLLPDVLHNITQQTFIMRGFPWHYWHLNYTSPTYQTINGEIDPVVSISPGETQLWRFASIDPATFYNITFAGHTFSIVTEDGNPVWDVWDAKYLVLPAGKRFDVLVTGGENGTYPLKMLPYKYLPYPEVTLATINVQGNATSEKAEEQEVGASSLVPRLNLGDREVQVQRTLVFSPSPPSNTTLNRFGEQGTNMINGKVFDRNRVDQIVKLGDLEEWTLTNVDNEDHTFHIHVNDFQVMSVNGQRYDAHGLQDTVILPANSEVVVRIPFVDFVGRFVYHCHILPHEDTGMMGIVEVVDPFTPPFTPQ
ncbi:MAG TPA: multicopper oxidase family protein [Nitrososphaeraceae archaeon]|nr:multicopper oxidase family protein [Nitrososphaeraceae archaeon]